jgi:molybdate transport system substrate-binding protein
VRLRFISAGAAQGLASHIAGARGIDIEGSFGAVGAMLEKLDAGEPCDIVILTRAQVDGLAARGKVRADSAADLGLVPTAIAVRAGDAHPDVSSQRALREALLAADALYFPDPAKATAGIHFSKVIDALGIGAAIAARIRNFPNGTASMRAMSSADGRPIGCTQATEILATPGIELVADLPPGFDLSTMYTAAVATDAQHRQAAAEFVAALTGPDNAALRARSGFHAASPAA